MTGMAFCVLMENLLFWQWLMLINVSSGIIFMLVWSSWRWSSFFFVFVCLLASPCPFTFHSLTSWKADGPRIGRRRRIRRCFSRGRPRKGEEEGRSRFAHSYHGHLLLRLILLLLLILEMRASCAAISAAAFYRRATVHDNDVIEILFLFFSSLSWAGARAFGPAEKSLCRPW